MRKIKKIVLLLGIICVFFLEAATAFALEVKYPPIFGLTVNGNDLAKYVCYIYGACLNLAIILAVIVIAFGGLYYIISFGRGKFTSEAKEWIKAGILGLIIMVCATLILYTINPSLSTCKVGVLTLVGLNPISSLPSTPLGAAVAVYKEVPVGTLTENLLTRTMDCYSFDNAGNPINGPQIPGSNNFAPTYMDHDRVDCITQLNDAVQEKTQVIAKLSDEISKLMNTCKCDGKCSDSCNSGGNGCNNDPPSCTGTCNGAACAPSSNSDSCCSNDVKQQIEHGPVQVNMCDSIISGDPEIDPGPQGSGNQIGSASDPCLVNALTQQNHTNPPGIIKKAMDITIGSNVDKQAVQWAMSQWNKVTPYPVFGNIIVSSSSSNIGNSSGGAIFFAPVQTSSSWTTNTPAFAVENSYYNSSGNVNNFTISINTSSADYSLHNMEMGLLHELGHAVGLADSYDIQTGQTTASCYKKSVMDYQYDMTGPGQADIQEIKQLYSSSSAFNNNWGWLINTAYAANSNSTCGCNTPVMQFAGLDEFRCPGPKTKNTPCQNLSSFVEKQVQYNNKTVTIIDPKKWNQLTLLQQLTYFKEKIEQIKQAIKADSNALSQATSTLDSQQCYKAKSYVDLLNIYKTTDQNQKIILTQDEFKDPQTNKQITVDKYCNGFNYANSSCLKTCNDQCPDTSQQVMKCYQKCQQCQSGDFKCLNNQEKCVENCYDTRPCTLAKNTSENFSDCLNSCQNDCSSICAKKYPQCSDEYKFCQSQCQTNSQCSVDNADQCLFGSEQVVQCSKEITDPGNTQYCINNAYTCQNGSSQFPAYSDCVANNAKIQTSQNKNTALQDSQNNIQAGQNCSTVYNSASFLYDHPECELCPNEYLPAVKGSYCYDSSNPSAPCSQVCPQTLKCPAASNCPICPCDQVDKDFNFLVANKNNGTNFGNEGQTKINKAVSAHQLVGPQCNNYSYNDDPLTFYCQDNWWQDPENTKQEAKPKGLEMRCEQSGEIPVGQTVDAAQAWANSIINTVDKTEKSLQQIFDDAKKITSKNPNQYCTCDSKYDSGSPICTSSCEYVPPTTSTDDQGNPVTTDASCALQTCSGNSCKQMIDYMTQIWNDSRQIRLDYIDLYVGSLQEPRSDILKGLTYARNQTDSCSAVNNLSGASEQILSCTNVENELIPDIIPTGTNLKPLDYYCYGKNLGNLKSQTLTDNWFCCQQTSKNQN